MSKSIDVERSSFWSLLFSELDWLMLYKRSSKERQDRLMKLLTILYDYGGSGIRRGSLWRLVREQGLYVYEDYLQRDLDALIKAKVVMKTLSPAERIGRTKIPSYYALAPRFFLYHGVNVGKVRNLEAARERTCQFKEQEDLAFDRKATKEDLGEAFSEMWDEYYIKPDNRDFIDEVWKRAYQKWQARQPKKPDEPDKS